MATNEDVWTERELDEALDAAREQADEAPDETYAAGVIRGAEFFHRYLLERRRLTDDDP